jgi:hypothetical protein
MVNFADQDTIVRIDTLANNFDPRTVVPVLAWPYKAGRRNRFRPSAYAFYWRQRQRRLHSVES